MSFLSIDNVKIAGISACVPQRVEESRSFPLFNETDADSFVKGTGVERRHIAGSEVCSSDLCLKAAEKIIEELKWSKEDIDALVFVTQTPDYRLPATSAILQDRLGLSENCFAIDISLGCSGWVYALSVISSLLSHGSMKKGLLLAGDTILKFCSPLDKSTYPLFGDAGSAVALEYTKGESESIKFCFNTDGSGSKAIIIEDGGFRNPVNEQSFKREYISDGIQRNNLDLALDGMDVFSFGISKAPKSVKDLISHYDISIDEVDYFTFHQANKFMNEKIRKKLKISEDKVPYSLKDFGNTSCATIPLTMVSQLSKELSSSELNHIACGFGVGLSWASCYFKTENIVCPELIIY